MSNLVTSTSLAEKAKEIMEMLGIGGWVCFYPLISSIPVISSFFSPLLDGIDPT